MNKPIRRILFIMCDQLRWDYLSCYGHPHLHTPHIDSLAAEGVRFDRAYVQSPICGPARMSFYTGRYVISHGSTWNGYPLRIGEQTLGDYLRPLGVRCALAGKTHMRADVEGMQRLGIDPQSGIGVHAAQCGFEPYERDDGLHPDGYGTAGLAYNDYLAGRGYEGDNGWDQWANSAQDADGTVLSGWFMENADRPARVDQARERAGLVGRVLRGARTRARGHGRRGRVDAPRRAELPLREGASPGLAQRAAQLRPLAERTQVLLRTSDNRQSSPRSWGEGSSARRTS